MLLAAWWRTHWLLRESGVWKDRNTDEVRNAQRHADYAYRLAVDPPAAKEVRLFGLADWVIDRFAGAAGALYDLQCEATRLRERSVLGACSIVAGRQPGLFLAGWRADDLGGTVARARAVTVLQLAVGVAGDRVRRAQLGARRRGRPGRRRSCASSRAMAEAGALPPGHGHPGDRAAPASRCVPRRALHLPGTDRPILDGLDLTIPAGSSLAIVGQNGAGKTTLAKLLCRLYDPTAGAIEVDGDRPARARPRRVAGRVAAVFQDFVRFELSLRDNVAPGRPAHRRRRSRPRWPTPARTASPASTRRCPGPTRAASTSRAGSGNGSPSPGRWRGAARGPGRAARRADRAARRPRRGRDLRAGPRGDPGATTILVSHRFSTVRLADRICVVEHGRVVELGSHDELIALGGRYRTMFDMQASRFVETDDEGEEVELESLD